MFYCCLLCLAHFLWMLVGVSSLSMNHQRRLTGLVLFFCETFSILLIPVSKFASNKNIVGTENALCS